MSAKQDPSGRRQFLKQSAGALAGASALLARDTRKAAGADHKDIGSQLKPASRHTGGSIFGGCTLTRRKASPPARRFISVRLAPCRTNCQLFGWTGTSTTKKATSSCTLSRSLRPRRSQFIQARTCTSRRVCRRTKRLRPSRSNAGFGRGR